MPGRPSLLSSCLLFEHLCIMQLSDGPSDEGTAINPLTQQDDIEEPAAEEEAFTDAFEEEDEEDFRHRKLLNNIPHSV